MQNKKPSAQNSVSVYPIGQQDFRQIRESNCIYVDKTRYIEKIILQESQYIFLARPRRFGKSLFLSTMRYFFEGERQLFDGLQISDYDWDWQPYPVLRLDLNTDRYSEMGQLDMLLDNIFCKWEELYQVVVKSENLSTRFQNIIEAAHRLTGRQVVILVDEYDKPLVGNLRKNEQFEHYRSRLASIYSNFKSSAEHIRLVFLTGVSRFSKLSVFSDLNNLNDISFDDEYADICGITEKELTAYFTQGISLLAGKMRLSVDDTLKALKSNYDGYRFAPAGSDIYNPWSLLNCLQKSRIGNYWNKTGIPTLIAESLHATNVDLEKILNTRCSLDMLMGLDLRNASPLALLYQAGYLTIKNYNFRTDRVTLAVPNREVKKGLFDELLPYYVNVKRGTADMVVNDILDDIIDGQPEKLMEDINVFLAGIPYELKIDNENNFQNAIYILLTLIGVETDAEVHTSDGRIDLLIKTPDFIYVIELKFSLPAEQALQQINDKDYALPYRNDKRRLFKIGVAFDKATRRLSAPVIE